jgi:secondary thiamine-phosphate synthase enzyme
MTAFHASIDLETPARVHFSDLTEEVAAAVAGSGIGDGVVLAYSQHTTCSVLIQEASHDATYFGTEFLLQDMVGILEGLAPTAAAEGEYLHPGPLHIADAESRGEEAHWSLNVDAHLRSVLLGRSVSIPLVDGELVLGEFGRVFFVDFDQVRARPRTLHVNVVG